MKRETIEKRIKENLYTKAGKLMVKYSAPVEWLQRGGKDRVHPCTWCRSGRHISLSDHRSDYIIALKKLGIDYVADNDAPRGGMEGEYIELTAKGKRQVKEYSDYYTMKRKEECEKRLVKVVRAKK